MRSYVAAIACAAVSSSTVPPCTQFNVPNLETPCYTSVFNSSQYEIRAYAVANIESWSTAHVSASSYNTAQQNGFQDNFAYISGANTKRVKIPMTAPVISRSNNSVDWDISFYTPASLYPTLESVPQPSGKNMSIDGFPAGGILQAVAGFGGFATADEFIKTATQLRAALAKDGRQLASGGAFTEVWAQYDSPYVVFNRHNEVWIQVEM